MPARQEMSFSKAIDTLPIVDKDSLPRAVELYGALLKSKGVRGEGLRRAVDAVETILFYGNPYVTQRTLEFIKGVAALK